MDEAIESVRARSSIYETVEDAAVEGDQIIIDFEGKVDGETFEGGSARQFPFVLGSKRFFSEFEAVLEGAKAGDEKTCEVPFPEDYFNETLRGKKAAFTITAHEVKRRQLPALDDEFAKRSGFDTLEAMRESVREQLKERTESTSQTLLERNAIRAVVEGSTFELPKSLLDSSAETYYRQEISRLAQSHVPMSEIEKREDDLRKWAQETALEQIKSFVALSEIGGAEGIEVTDEDFEKMAEDIQTRSGMDMSTISTYLAQDEQHDEYSGQIFRRKAMAVIIDSATITDTEVPEDELEEEENAEHEA